MNIHAGDVPLFLLDFLGSWSVGVGGWGWGWGLKTDVVHSSRLKVSWVVICFRWGGGGRADTKFNDLVKVKARYPADTACYGDNFDAE